MSEKKNNPDQEIENTVSVPRRTVVKSTVIGGAAITGAAVSGKWSKPVVDSVILPAHATTSEVAADDGEAPPEPDPVPEPVPTPRNFFGPVSNMVGSTKTINDTQIAGSRDRSDLLQLLAKQAMDTIVPKANAQSAEAASLCVAEDQGAVDVVLQLVNPFTPFGPENGTVNFTGAGMLDSAIMLATTCTSPFQVPGGAFGEYTITLTDSMDGNLMFSLDFVAPFRGKVGGGTTTGSIPEGACGQGAQVCPVFEELEQEFDINAE